MNIAVDAHTHSIASGHAYSTIREIAEEAARKGLKAVAITDHAPKMPGASHYMHFLNFETLPEKLFGVRILPGVELNILNTKGEVDMSEKTLRRLKVIIASIHSPCFEIKAEYQDKIESVVTSALISVMKNPFVKFIGHPGDPRFPYDIEKVVSAAERTGTALEINEQSAANRGSRAGGLQSLQDTVRECVKQGALISFGSDSHFFYDVGDFTHSARLADEMGVPERLVVNASYERFMEFIDRKKPD